MNEVVGVVRQILRGEHRETVESGRFGKVARGHEMMRAVFARPGTVALSSGAGAESALPEPMLVRCSHDRS